MIENVHSTFLPNVDQDERTHINPKIVGIEYGDTVLSIKLRGQDQLDIPAHWIRVSRKGKICDSWEVIQSTKNI